MVAVKQLKEGRLSTGGALGPPELQGSHPVIQLIKIHQQLIEPQGRTLSNGGELSRLIVGKAQCGHGFIFLCKFRKGSNHIDQPLPNQLKALPHKDHIGVVPHIAAGGAQMDNGHGLGALLTKGMDMGHYVMAQALFLFSVPHRS